MLRLTIRLQIIVVLLATLASSAAAQTFFLSYHRIDKAPGFALAVSHEDLETQLSQLLEQGYQFDIPSATTLFTKGTVFIVFDDGYKDVFELAYPVLSRYGIAATVFVATERVGTAGFMSWEDLRLLESHGWSIGSHTSQHASLRDLTPASIRTELQTSRAMLEAQLHEASAFLAYPFGRHDQRVRSIANETYSYGLTTGFSYEPADTLALGRPLPTPFDNWVLGWRLESGFDLRTPVILTELGYWLVPLNAAAVERPAFYQPARYLFMGSGQVGLDWHNGSLYQDFFYREGFLALSGVTARVGGSYSELSIIAYQAPVSLGAGVSSHGAFLASSLNLFDYGEIWGSLDTSGNYAIGTELLPFDYFRLSASYRPNKAALQLKYGLPLFPEEGRPLRILLGYDSKAYLGTNLNIGGTELEGRLSLDGSIGAGFRLSW